MSCPLICAHTYPIQLVAPRSSVQNIGVACVGQFLLRACHIGEVQHGWYNPAEVEILKKDGIQLLGLGEFDADPSAKST